MKGFSLIELLISIVIFSIIMGCMYGFLTSQQAASEIVQATPTHLTHKQLLEKYRKESIVTPGFKNELILPTPTQKPTLIIEEFAKL